jgi:hypothetical protein
MSAVVIVLLSLLAVAVIVAVIARMSPSAIELLDLDPRTRAGARMAAEDEDMRQLLELTNRRRRAAGLEELAEEDLREADRR